MRISEITSKKPKTPEELQVDALKQRADQAAARLKVTKQQKRLSGIQKSLAKLQSNS
jgi:hypothetical protein